MRLARIYFRTPQLVFGLGHLPMANVLTETVTTPLLVYVLVGNGLFGLIAGFLYWRKGVECAMMAHIVMVSGERLMV